MPVELAPPESLQPSVQLTPPEPVSAVATTEAEGLVKLSPTTVDYLDAKVDEFVDIVMDSQVQTEPFNMKLQAIHKLGNEEIEAAASVSNRMLDKPTNSMQIGLFDEKSSASRALVDLRKIVEDLDPKHQGDLFAPKRIFGIFPGGNRLRDYFLKYQSSQDNINAIIQSLENSQDELMKDNASLEEEKVNLWQVMGKLQQYIYVARRIDSALVTRINQIEAQNPEKARVVKEEMLFYVRQKVQDLLTQLAVSIQGYLALDMIRKNNMELIKGVDRAKTTTVSALRTAIIVAQALANQRLVLDQINALNTTTGSIIESTSAMLRGQTAEVHQQATSSTISLEKLQTAFSNIYETMDMISAYKLEALDSMETTVNTLSTEVNKAQGYLDRVREAEAVESAGDLMSAFDDEIRL